jgi:O-Antigen ligase
LNLPRLQPHLVGVFRSFTQLRAADVPLYQLCDQVSGAVILLMAVFSPWAFGTTQPWAIWAMNYATYFLGVLLLVKLFIRKIKKFPAPRWDVRVISEHRKKKGRRPARVATRLLAWLTMALLAYCLVHVLNAAATYDAERRLFLYRPYIGWLPHSFDANRGWFYFWQYLGLAAGFWSVRDWLLGQTAVEEKNIRLQPEDAAPIFPARLRQLVWLLAFSGLALGIEGIVQRVSGAHKLLFVLQPVVNPEGDTQFGTYAYRSNAAQYFNLLWPLCLGVWWWFRDGGGKNYLLPVAAAVMAACPIISISRGGAMVVVGLLLLLIPIYLIGEYFARKNSDSKNLGKQFIWLVIFLAVVVGLGGFFGWEKLSPRLQKIGEGFSGREEMFTAAQPMAADYPLFGTGPGTFATVFQLYRISNATYWPEQLHNDWLETQITFGWIGLLLVLTALGCVVTAGFFAPRKFALAAGLALGGCLIHACFDFPLQIHSVLFLFLLICALVLALGVMPRRN